MSSRADPEPLLARVAEQLEAMGSAAEIYDREWSLVWMTSQFRFFAGGRPLEQLGLGQHPVTVRTSPLDGMTPLETGLEWMRKNIPLMAHDTPGGIDAIRALLPDDYDEAIGPLDPQPPETLWWGELTYLQDGQPPAQTRYLTFALDGPDGQRAGWVMLYVPAAPASIVSLITRGDQRMFARMAELLSPSRHETAILFADIQASSALARRLSTQRWFELIREFSTFTDQVVVENTGIVGRHAGDGLAAFFLAEQVGSRAAACAAALHAAREIVSWGPEELGDSELHINAGVHWGGALYLGQVVTGGRLEVTALGDEVNECARIEQSARDGALLASKPVVERLDIDDAHALGLDPLTVMYRTVGELPDVTPKAVRDAGGVPVVAVPRRAAVEPPQAMALGIITGSGTYSLPGFEGTRPEPQTTEWGDAYVSRGTFAGADVLHISRHGEGHVRLSNHVTHLAHIAALKRLGATGVLAVTVCGAVDPSVELGSLICFDDLHFLANRLPDGRLCTFHQQAGHADRAHWIYEDPYSPGLRAALLAGAEEAGVAAGDGGCYGHVDGPRFNTKAEIRGLAAAGVTAVSQTAGPETVLAGEAQLPLALIGYATDYANGVGPEATPVERLLELIAASTETFARVLAAAVARIDESALAPAGIVHRFHSD